MIFLDKLCPFVKIIPFDEKYGSPDKAKPSVRRGWKGAGLLYEIWPSCRRMNLFI
jgi:hypothetical protein